MITWILSPHRNRESLSTVSSVESVQTAAEDPAAGQSGAEPEAEDGPTAVRAVCEGDDVTFFLLPTADNNPWKTFHELHTTSTSFQVQVVFVSCAAA